jgi:hypothetical protein
MPEPGRVPPLLRLCRGCRQFVRLNEADCPFCGGDIKMLQADYEKRLADMRCAAAELREALARVRLAGEHPEDLARLSTPAAGADTSGSDPAAH